MSVTYPSPDVRIYKLSPIIHSSLSRELGKNNEHGDPHWKMLVQKLPQRLMQNIEVTGADDILMLLGNQQKTVGYLMIYLEDSGCDDALALLKPPIDIKITQEPVSPGNVHEGDELMLECVASGFPRLQYQWYKYKQKLPNQTKARLHIPTVSQEDSGDYCCAVKHFVRNERRHKFTDIASVHVVDRPIRLPDPHPDSNEILFEYHPSSLTVKVNSDSGVTLPLEVLAKGPGNIKYEWFKNQQPIRDVCGRLLNLHISPYEEEVIIQCQANNEFGQKALCPPCKLTVEQDFMYEAKDKVALLIGNMAYRSGPPLDAARKDVESLSKELKKLQFKVYSYIDLSVEEMRKAVEIFCDLISKDVYAVFYFAGHGFEHKGQCYMVGYDAPTDYPFSHCLCAEEVEYHMQEKDPALCFSILDICREVKEPEDQGILKTFQPKANANRIVLYATSFTLNAYEDRLKNEGIMLQCLKKVIHKNVNVDRMAEAVKNELRNNYLVTGKQIAECTSNLNRPRKLTDPTKGDASILNKWMKAHTIDPKYSVARPHVIVIPRVNIELKVWCTAEHSNMLTLHVNLSNLGCAESVELDFRDSPLGLVMQKLPKAERPGYIALTFSDLQALKDDIDIVAMLSVKILAKTGNSPQGKLYEHTVAIPLGKPLISVLPIWRRAECYDVEGLRMPTEQEDSNFSSSAAAHRGPHRQRQHMTRK